MEQYSIKDLELLTGIKSHTLRVWESRYGIIEPKRTSSNIRYYLSDDLRNILNVAHLNKMGYKISKIAQMCKDERNELVIEDSNESTSSENQIQALVKAMLDFDEQSFNHVMSNITLRLGFEKCMLQVIYPFLEKIGMLWQASSICVAQEHFVSNLLKQKIMAATDGQMLKEVSTSVRALLFCPPGELHELNLLFANYMLRSRGVHTLYLGADLPVCDLSKIKKHYDPNFFIMAINAGYAQKKFAELSVRLDEQLNHIQGFVIGGQCACMENLPENICIAKCYEDIDKYLKTLE